MKFGQIALLISFVSSQVFAGATCDLSAFAKAVRASQPDVAIIRMGERHDDVISYSMHNNQIFSGNGKMDIVSSTIGKAVATEQETASKVVVKMANGEKIPVVNNSIVRQLSQESKTVSRSPKQLQGLGEAEERRIISAEFEKIPPGREIAVETEVGVRYRARYDIEKLHSEYELRRKAYNADLTAVQKELDEKIQLTYQQYRNSPVTSDLTYLGKTAHGDLLFNLPIKEGTKILSYRTMAIDPLMVKTFKYVGPTMEKSF